MDIWKIEVKGESTLFLTSHRQTNTYCGTATKPEIAIRAALSSAKKDFLQKRKVKSLEHIGHKDFGKK